MSKRGDARVPFPLDGGCQTVSYDTSTRTAAGVGAQTRKVAVHVSTDAHYVFGDSSCTATTSDTFLAAGGEHFVSIAPGQYVAFIKASGGTAGSGHVSEFAG